MAAALGQVKSSRQSQRLLGLPTVREEEISLSPILLAGLKIKLT